VNKRSIGYGRGEVTLQEADLHFIDPQAVLDKLRAVLEAPTYEPPVLPAAALDVLELSRKPDAAFGDIRKVMERDALLAAKVLRVAQSSAYSGASGAIRTLDDALVRLGMRTLAFIFMEAAMKMKVFRAPGYEEPMQELSRHSAASAHLSRHIARRTSIYDEHSFLCGLLHDVGIAASLIALTQLGRGAIIPPFDEVWPAVRDAHEMASGIVCRSWNLPGEITMVVANHHQVSIGGHVHPVAAVLSVADWVATQHGFGMRDEAREPLPNHLAAIGLSARDLKPLVDECAAVVANVGD
jgi:HD-like signal output (HDOD) protein